MVIDMTRLIDVDELEKNLSNDLPYKSSVKRVLIQAPTVDAVEVVYCKNCFSHRELDEEELRILKNNFCYCNRIHKYMPERGFCSLGERMG